MPDSNQMEDRPVGSISFYRRRNTPRRHQSDLNLNAKGINATLDHLGESVTDPDEAHQAAGAIIRILEEINETGVKSSVSISRVKLACCSTMIYTLRISGQSWKRLKN